MKLYTFIEKSYTTLFHLTLAFMLFDWVLPLPRIGGILGIYEILYLLLAISFFSITINKRDKIMLLFRSIIKSNYVILTVFALYLIMGVITIFYAQYPSYVIPRYFVAIQMAGFLLFGLLYVFHISNDPQTAILRIFTNIGFSALFIAICSLIGYKLGLTAYNDKISPYQDYNQYAVILLFGYVSFIIPILFSDFLQKKFIMALLLSLPVFFTAIYTSGSRRGYLMLIGFTTILFFIAAIVQIIKYKKYGKIFKGFSSILLLIVALSLSFFATNATADYISKVKEIRTVTEEEITLTDSETESTKQENPPIKTESNDLKKHYQTVYSGEALNKRELIWNAATHKILSSEPHNLIFGYGASYSSDLYDETDDPHVETVRNSYQWHMATIPPHWMDPHNIFLQDLLEGGILLFLLQSSVILVILIQIIRGIKKEPLLGTSLFMLMTILFLTLVVSCGMGLIANKFTWIGLMIIISLNHTIKQKRVICK